MKSLNIVNSAIGRMLIVVAAMATPMAVSAQLQTSAVVTASDSTAEGKQPCPDRRKLKHICTAVNGRMVDRSGMNTFLYQTKLMSAACVTPDTPELLIRQRIQEVWALYSDDLRCNSAGFDVTNGHILKYAFGSEFVDFLNDAIRWKVDLNIVDPSDNRTLLDYVQYWIDKNRGNELEQRYRNYYLKFRDAGALHRYELPKAGVR